MYKDRKTKKSKKDNEMAANKKESLREPRGMGESWDKPGGQPGENINSSDEKSKTKTGGGRKGREEEGEN